VKAVSFKVLGLALVVLLVTSLPAEEKPARKKNAGRAVPRRLTDVQNKLASLKLTEDQQKKVDDIFASYKQKFAEAQAKAPKLTKEQRQIQKDVTAKARAEGKKGKELQAEVNTALNLTDEQRKGREAATAAANELQAALKKELTAVLTPDQAVVLSKGKKKK
jgi:Spy/CpxP family protein refolding chaperone